MAKSNIKFQQGKTDLFASLGGDDNTDENKISIIKERISELFNMKNIHFLFGSGTSVKAIPTMEGLFNDTEAVIKGLDETESDIKEEFERLKDRADGKNLEDILGFLYSYKVYLDNYEEKKSDFETCEKLIEKIEGVIFDKINVDFTEAEAKNSLEVYKRFYQKIALRNKDLARINVFTTNNDLFNEMALNSLNIHYINGFNGGLNKYFNPALFNYTFSKRMDTSIDKFEPVENMVNLYKVHGSINWVEDTKNENTFFNIKEIYEADREKNNVLIYPTPTKQNKSLGSPYVEMFREFQGRLLEPLSVLFVIGYSFSDEHVNNVIYQALATNSTMNLFILNDVSNRDIFNIEDDRIFKVWGETSEGEKIHYFNAITEKLLPNVNAFKAENKSVNEFIKFYNEKLAK